MGAKRPPHTHMGGIAQCVRIAVRIVRLLLIRRLAAQALFVMRHRYPASEHRDRAPRWTVGPSALLSGASMPPENRRAYRFVYG